MPKVVAIGASQGGVGPVLTIAKGLRGDFPAAVLVTVHIGTSNSRLPELLNNTEGLRAELAEQGAPLQSGRIYVAPPDRHLIVSRTCIELTHGPKENWTRPAVDPLFRSAAEAFGPEAIGVVLSGRLNDGTAGLFEIKRRGGVSIVQEPTEAEAPDMPQNALHHVEIDYCLRARDIPEVLYRLAEQEVAHAIGARAMTDQKETRPAALICPACGGSLREETLGKLTLFRCHIGHAMTAEVMAAGQSEQIERTLEMAQRLLKERGVFCRDMIEKSLSSGDEKKAHAWRKAAAEVQEREPRIREILEASWTHPESLQD